MCRPGGAPTQSKLPSPQQDVKVPMGESLPWLPSRRHEIRQRRVSSDFLSLCALQVSELTATARMTELLRSASLHLQDV